MTAKPRAPKSSSKVWNLANRPACFDSAEAWADWLAERNGAHSPCEDCTPEFKRASIGRLRCVRPETVFMRADDGEVFGVSADDPRFARILLGMEVYGAELVGRGIERTERWTRLLRLLERRAHPAVKRAIALWFLKSCKRDSEAV